MKLDDCEQGMELRPFKRHYMWPLRGRLIVSEVVKPKSPNDPRVAGVRFEGIHGTFRPMCFAKVKKVDELEEGDFFISSIGYKYEVLARAYDEYSGLMQYLVKNIENGSINMYSEEVVRRGKILYTHKEAK